MGLGFRSGELAMKKERLPPIVAIGASGGDGLDDIRALLAALPWPVPAVILVVLHRPVDRISNLRDILARASRIEVRVAAQNDRFEPGICYIGEPDQHLTLTAHSLADMVDDADNRHRNRTIDTLFHSVAEHAGARMIGVVLSGSLDDGSRGLAAIHHAGGTTMVLDPTGQAFPGMPRNAIRYDGPINLIGSAAEIAAGIGRLLKAGLVGAETRR
jgi:two-component system chemotaxis response regulator CheB